MSKEINNPSRSELITDFVKTNPNYYIDQFQKIGSKPTFSFSFNLYAAILGPIWFGMRNIWNWALTFSNYRNFFSCSNYKRFIWEYNQRCSSKN